MGNKLNVRATFIELFNRIIDIKRSDKDKVYLNGENNLYPNEIESVINNSPTAKRCANLFYTYVAGKLQEDFIVNEWKGITIADVVSDIAKSLSRHNGAYIHVKYGLDPLSGEIVPVEPTVLEYSKMRNSKEDDDENKGKYYYADWTDKNCDKDKIWYYPFNNNQEVIKAQIKKDYDGDDTEDYLEMLPSYRGQVYYLNFDTEYQYALSLVDSVYNDADTEYRIALYANTQSRLGFLGKLLVLTQGLDEEVSNKIKEDIAEWLGSENSGGMYHLAVEQIDDLDNLLKIVQLKPQFEDKLFELTQKRIKENIIGAYGIPADLLESSSSIFDGGASKFQELKLAYCEYVRPYQLRIQRTLNFLGFNVIINPLETREEQNIITDENTAE